MKLKFYNNIIKPHFINFSTISIGKVYKNKYYIKFFNWIIEFNI